MVKAKKLPSGSWNIRVYSHNEGKKKIYKSITKPTKAECEFAAAEYKGKLGVQKKTPKLLTVREACERYIELSELLSPTTLANYKVYMKNGFQDIMDLPADSLDDDKMQLAINNEAKRKCLRTGKTISAKTVKNEYGLISAALSRECKLNFNVRLPSVQHKNVMLPEASEIMSAVKGTDVELPVLLALWCGMRMSEIRGLTFGAVHDGYIFINQVLVDVSSKPVLKTLAKTDSSIRMIRLPDEVKVLIDTISEGKNQDDLIVSGTHSEIYGAFKRAIKPHGLNIKFHDLRAMNASCLLNIVQLPDKMVQLQGGWSSPTVMQKVYNRPINSAQSQAYDLRDQFFKEQYK